ncbi:septal ring lytic transglycosylase RlpA family protein [Edaphobacter modestus]|uniref:Probable endolytic peptidoglycan transglycosylase RlpA n=1 Tax=Edaphobacter modestus TaxID=388466 RepID=A0A4Q7YQZ2_9BACT|nr:septal ring lytic transglycosylase RlpA family protein [Edaphobacter modestus]RZU39225.1 rare lipoprotein A [Edaphobacter modestus]
MKIISTNMGDKTVPTRRGVAIATLLVALGMTASASDATAPATGSDTNPANPAQQQHTKPRRWYQIGTASWYGRYFQGKQTANGESYDMNGLTCAHRSLPLGTWLRVTNLKNRKSVFVRVNDRGPMPDDRIVDLSYGAAKAVGISGLAKVKLEKLLPGDPEMARQLIAQLHVPIAVGQGL